MKNAVTMATAQQLATISRRISGVDSRAAVRDAPAFIA